MERLSIVGVDGAGKDTGIDELVNNPPCNARVFSGRAMIGRGMAEHFELTPSSRPSAAMKLLAGVSYGMATHVRYEPHLVSLLREYDPHVVVSARDPIIDSVVYGRFYFSVLGVIPPASFVKLLHGIGHPFPEHVIFYDAEPEVAMERINRATVSRALMPNPRKRQHHETIEGLCEIRKAYHEAIRLVAQMGAQVDVIDTTGLSISQATTALYDILDPVFKRAGIASDGAVKLLVVR